MSINFLCVHPRLGASQKLIRNALPISAIVGKVKLSINLGRIVDLMP